MTRENKLSIVIAFGLLIFVGMLVADHFSPASHRKVADLGSNVSTPPLLSPTVLLDGPPPSYTSSSSTFSTTASGGIVHTVVQGETLRSICSDFYGDSGLASGVAQWNNLQNPNAIERGAQISLPPRASLVIGMFTIPSQHTNSPETITQTPSAQSPAKMGSYTVKDGDTLSEIAQRVMGTTKKTQILIEVNKDVMPNPDRIKPGMILQYPLQTS